MNNNTRRTIILLLSRLLHSKTSKQKAMYDLNIKDAAFYKYIQYIKEAGFIVKHNKGEYKVLAFSEDVKLDERDEAFFADLLSMACCYLPSSKAKIFRENITKILEHSDLSSYLNIEKRRKETEALRFNKAKCKKTAIIQKSILSGKILKITTKHNTKYMIKPLKIIFEKEKCYADFYDVYKKINQRLPIDMIAKIDTNSIDEDIYIKDINETIFELNGKLADSYVLKENERIADKFSDRIIIANSSGNKTDLFKRLLRYDVFCKILFPKYDVENFKEFVKHSLKNITDDKT